MAFIETWEEKHGAASPKNEEGPEPSENLPLRQILASKHQSKLFGLYMEQKGAHELGQKLLAGDLSEEALTDLNQERKGFLVEMEHIKDFEEKLDEGVVDGVVASSSHLKQMAEAVSTPKMMGLVKRHLREVAIKNPGEFAKIEKTVLDLQNTKKSIEKENKNIEDLREKYQLGEYEYMKALRSDDPEALRKLMRSKMGFLKKIGKGYLSGSFGDEVNSANKRGDIERSLQTLKRDRGALADVLRTTLLKPENKEELKKMISGEDISDKASFEDGRKMFKEGQGLSQEGLLKEWGKYREENAGLFEDASPEEIERLQENFAEGYVGKTVSKGKKGFWSSMITSLFKPAVVEILKNQK